MNKSIQSAPGWVRTLSSSATDRTWHKFSPHTHLLTHPTTPSVSLELGFHRTNKESPVCEGLAVVRATTHEMTTRNDVPYQNNSPRVHGVDRQGRLQLCQTRLRASNYILHSSVIMCASLPIGLETIRLAFVLVGERLLPSLLRRTRGLL